MSKFVLFDQGVPIPDTDTRRRRIKTQDRRSAPKVKDAFFLAFEVGDSYFFDGIDHQHPVARKARAMSKRTKLEFTARREANGLRIWRIK